MWEARVLRGEGLLGSPRKLTRPAPHSICSWSGRRWPCALSSSGSSWTPCDSTCGAPLGPGAASSE